MCALLVQLRSGWGVIRRTKKEVDSALEFANISEDINLVVLADEVEALRAEVARLKKKACGCTRPKLPASSN